MGDLVKMVQFRRSRDSPEESLEIRSLLRRAEAHRRRQLKTALTSGRGLLAGGKRSYNQSAQAKPRISEAAAP